MSTSRVFHPLLFRIVLLVAPPAAVTMWAFGPIAATAVGLVLVTVELWRVRRALRRSAPPEVAFVPARPTDHLWLDAEAFRLELAALHELGFIAIADYALYYPGAAKNFARVLVHPEHRVYAEVQQARLGRTTLPVATTFESVLTDGWSMQSTTRDPQPVDWAFMRAPKSLWSAHPDALLDELLADHIALRDDLCSDLAVRIGGAGTLEDFFAVRAEYHRRRAVAVRRTNVVGGILRGLRCERSTRREWMGGYAPRTSGLRPAAR